MYQYTLSRNSRGIIRLTDIHVSIQDAAGRAYNGNLSYNRFFSSCINFYLCFDNTTRMSQPHGTVLTSPPTCDFMHRLYDPSAGAGLALCSDATETNRNGRN